MHRSWCLTAEATVEVGIVHILPVCIQFVLFNVTNKAPQLGFAFTLQTTSVKYSFFLADACNNIVATVGLRNFVRILLTKSLGRICGSVCSIQIFIIQKNHFISLSHNPLHCLQIKSGYYTSDANETSPIELAKAFQQTDTHTYVDSDGNHQQQALSIIKHMFTRPV